MFYECFAWSCPRKGWMCEGEFSKIFPRSGANIGVELQMGGFCDAHL
ncbi:Hypothetical protein CpOVI1FL_0700 [Corynebacterium pseudotuberculosis]|nr:Hypothetical protein CpOVI1FL_0700 [Corynebacterium pseudotuberculosis]